MKNDRIYKFTHILESFFSLFSTMDFSVLSPDFTKQLEQQLSRLQNEREDIIAQAAQAVDIAFIALMAYSIVNVHEDKLLLR